MQATFHFADSKEKDWEPLILENGKIINGVKLKKLVSANGNQMELYQFEPNITYPDHYHEGPEFVFIIEGSIRQNNQWLTKGWASSAETGTLDHNAKSGEQGCTLLTVYQASDYID